MLHPDSVRDADAAATRLLEQGRDEVEPATDSELELLEHTQRTRRCCSKIRPAAIIMPMFYMACGMLIAVMIMAQKGSAAVRIPFLQQQQQQAQQPQQQQQQQSTSVFMIASPPSLVSTTSGASLSVSLSESHPLLLEVSQPRAVYVRPASDMDWPAALPPAPSPDGTW